jgi:peptidoglycan-associated lipoprotein
MANRFRLLSTAVLSTTLFLTACSTKKTTQVTQPTAPPAVAPTASLSAAPVSIQQGQSTTLSWQTTGATQITIDGLGTVPASGSRTIAPGSSQTYTLTATGTGGSTEARATVTVNPKIAQEKPIVTDDGNTLARIKDVFFEFDRSTIRAADLPVAQDDAHLLTQHPETSVLIEGHCDDRGSEEYNLALGVSRASAMRNALIQQGVAAGRIKTVSYGKEKPFCTQEDESCWQQNRRDHVVVQASK